MNAKEFLENNSEKSQIEQLNQFALLKCREMQDSIDAEIQDIRENGGEIRDLMIDFIPEDVK